MFKSKLNELCHKKKWALPKYSCMRDGPDHNPQFKASVVVDGVTFDTEAIWTSSKEAYNEAAKFAYLHFTSGDQNVTKEEDVPIKENSSQKATTNSEASDGKNGEKEDQELKKKLEIFAQRNNLGTPTYRCTKEGPPQHPLSFKGTVTIGGHSYDCSSLYPNLHDAEAAAAQAALLSLTIDAFRVENTNSYKDLLKEFAEKEGLFSPTYTTIKAGSNHELKFISMVEFNGERFCGKPANSSKQAEINAAMVAHTAIGNSEDIDSKKTNKTTDVTGQKNLDSTPEPVALPEMSSLSVSESRGNTCADMETKSYLLCNRVRVYTCIPESGLPEGTILLPIAESKWVAASLEFPDGVAT